MFAVVDLSNLPSAVEFALDAVTKRSSDGNLSPHESRDLEVALSALTVIKEELASSEVRPKGQRSAAFTRYALDEAPSLKIDDQLRRLIVRIEEIYKKY